jgi:hypothetical protein
MTAPTDPTLLNLYRGALRDIADVLADATSEEAQAALEIASDALTHALDEMEAQPC